MYIFVNHKECTHRLLAASSTFFFLTLTLPPDKVLNISVTSSFSRTVPDVDIVQTSSVDSLSTRYWLYLHCCGWLFLTVHIELAAQIDVVLCVEMIIHIDR